jgi:alkylation response protein AidB-like acyl-CoA dehydrogenase
MDFGFTEDQHRLRKTVREFTEAEIKPHVMEWDESQKFPLEVFRKLGHMGVLGAVFPEELGGSGYSYVDYAIVMEELARVDASIALSVAAHVSLCTNHIFIAASEEQKRRYIPKLATGEWIGAWSLTEPEAGSDAGQTRTSAVRDGDCWVLNGSKTFTTNAHIADVDVVMAVTDRAASSHGISAFILEKGTPGFRAGKKENKLGMRCSHR